MSIKLISEANSEQVRKYIIENKQTLFINDFLKEILPNYTPAQFRELIFSTNFICFAEIENELVINVCLLSLPPADTNGNTLNVVAISLVQTDFFSAILKELSFILEDGELEKITLNMMDNIKDETAKKFFSLIGFDIDLRIPTCIGDYIHMSYYNK